ncbi:MAG: site-2 protease family protein [Syntrophobacterales bacterium]|jgi:Zn-dependent protease|nr:site-2 protease family protein [Syntrophobacterales bacterium]
MGLLNLLFKDPFTFILVAIPLLYSIILHELAHGWVANKMGDPTARWLGRLALNPLKHLDPIGTAMLFIFGFGWAKPVPVNFNNLQPFRKGLIFVASAGIVTNIILAFISIFLLRFLSVYGTSAIHDLFYYMARINVMLAAFNLIPIPPLDGSKILMGFASRKFQYSLARIEPYGFFIILAALWLGILNPLINFIQSAIVLIINLLLP